jgi:pimeloyl-ACP methyl ester carboxylesterase
MILHLVSVAAAGIAAISMAMAISPAVAAPAGIKNIVLVHGAWADGSGWQGVYDILKKDGYTVSIVQNPLSSLVDDAAATKRVLALQDGPVILVGHSYGGAVITEAGNDPKVAGLVYIAAFAPDQGESLETLSKNAPPGSPVPPVVLPPQDGFLFLDKAKFHQAFAADLDAKLAAFMADSQAPLSVASFTTPITTPAWKTKKSWALIPSGDEMIGEAGETFMAKRAGATIVEFKGGSHAIYVSQPKVVADLIEKAATTVKLAAN